MWTSLVLLCLFATVDLGTARKSSEEANFTDRLRDNEYPSTAVRLPRKFPDNRLKRVQIENQTGFDGKVGMIHVDPEDKPGVRAYGLPKKNLADNGFVERIPGKELELDAPRSGRLVEAYGMSKQRLENNGEIERVLPPVLTRNGHSTPETRIPRSIDTEPENGKKIENEAEDMEAQEAKVFRPLFVYRQQQAKKQSRYRSKNQVHNLHHGNPKPWNRRQPVY